MTKTYNSPMLQIVSIKKSDVIATSDVTATIDGTTEYYLAPDRNMLGERDIYLGY